MLILKIWKLNKLRVTPSETQINVFIVIRKFSTARSRHNDLVNSSLYHAQCDMSRKLNPYLH
jgi:hypothetical protein